MDTQYAAAIDTLEDPDATEEDKEAAAALASNMEAFWEDMAERQRQENEPDW